MSWWDNPTKPRLAPVGAYSEQNQIWRKRAKGAYWVGWEKASPPCPESLVRPKQLAGELVTLSDGRQWLIPTARQLPCILGIDDEGNNESRLKPRYAEFYAQAEKALKEWCFGDGGMPFFEGRDLCVRALALNYRINLDVADALNLIGTDNLWDVVAAITSFRQIVAALTESQKKTAD